MMDLTSYSDNNISKMWGAIDVFIPGYTTPYHPIGLHIFLMKYDAVHFQLASVQYSDGLELP
jgi:hypothetical protein